MFKVGDRVKCVKKYSWQHIKIDDIYTIESTYVSSSEKKCVRIKDYDNNYFEYQFVLDIKENRKSKLDKLCSK